MEYWTKLLSAYKTRNISETAKIERKLLKAYIKSYTLFWLDLGSSFWGLSAWSKALATDFDDKVSTGWTDEPYQLT